MSSPVQDDTHNTRVWFSEYPWFSRAPWPRRLIPRFITALSEIDDRARFSREKIRKCRNSERQVLTHVLAETYVYCIRSICVSFREVESEAYAKILVGNA